MVVGWQEAEAATKYQRKRLKPSGALRKRRAGDDEEVRAKGGILSALRRSPLVCAALNLTRPVAQDRKVDL
jgi:hypothetical protein